MAKKQNKPKKQLEKKQPRKYALQGTSFPRELAAAKSFLAAREPQKAVGLYQRILQQDPKQLQALYSLAVILHRSGNDRAALAHIGKVVALQPEHIDSQILLSEVLLALGQQDRALQTLRELAKKFPREDQVFMALAEIEESCGNLEDAVQHLKKAFALNSKQVDALIKQARLMAAEGDSDTALTMLRRARSIKPMYGECHYRIATLSRQVEYSDDIKLMEQALQNSALTKADKIALSYALGKVFDDLQEYDRAFAYLEEANRLKLSSFPAPYTGEVEKAQFDRIKETFNKTFLSRHPVPASGDFKPVFVVGMPRSGTSLVEQILASHSQVFGAGELQDMNLLVTRLQQETGQPFPGGMDQLGEPQLSSLASQYLSRVRQESDTPVIVDKMPHNFRYLGLIAMLFPEARIIHCQRDPIDTCFSIYKQHFSESHPYACDLKNLGEYYGLYQDLMCHWNQVMPEQIYNLHYQELVENPEQQTRAMLEFCGLEFEPDCLRFFENKRAVHTPSANQVRQPIYRSALQHWQHYENHLEPLKAALDG